MCSLKRWKLRSSLAISCIFACRFLDTTPSPILHSSSSSSKPDKAGGNFGSVRDMILHSNPPELSSIADICFEGEDRLESSDCPDCDSVRTGREVPGDAIRGCPRPLLVLALGVWSTSTMLSSPTSPSSPLCLFGDGAGPSTIVRGLLRDSGGDGGWHWLLFVRFRLVGGVIVTWPMAESSRLRIHVMISSCFIAGTLLRACLKRYWKWRREYGNGC